MDAKAEKTALFRYGLIAPCSIRAARRDAPHSFVTGHGINSAWVMNEITNSCPETVSKARLPQQVGLFEKDRYNVGIEVFIGSPPNLTEPE